MFSFSNLVALGCIQGIIQSIYLFAFSGPSRILAFFLSLLSINMCVSFYIDSGLFDSSMLLVTIWKSLNSYLLLGPVLMAFIIKMINSDRHFNKMDAIHLLPFLVYFWGHTAISPYELSSFFSMQAGNLQQVSMLPFDDRFSFIPLATAVHFCVYLVFSSWYVFKFWLQQRDKNSLNQLCWLFTVLIISYLMIFSVFIVSITAVLMKLEKSHDLLVLSDLSTVAGIFYITYLLIRIGTPIGRLNISINIKSNPTSKSKEPNTMAQQNLLKRLDQELNTNKHYLRPDFNQQQLAEKMKISRHQLSELLTFHSSGSFYQLINQLRVEAVIKEMKERPICEKLINIAYDCGFNSKSSFNQVFKKYTKETPSQYRKLIKKENIESF
ncbi:helix-turn-helix domain-containing protein [Moritella viscosa]